MKGTNGLLTLVEKPSNNPIASAFAESLPNKLATQIKEGERGSPYLRPLLPLKKPLGDPFTNNENEGEEI